MLRHVTDVAVRHRYRMYRRDRVLRYGPAGADLVGSSVFQVSGLTVYIDGVADGDVAQRRYLSDHEDLRESRCAHGSRHKLLLRPVLVSEHGLSERAAC